MSKRKIIEVYIEEKENDDEVEITFQLLEQTKIAQNSMERLVYGMMLANKQVEIKEVEEVEENKDEN